jgi:hypothetical protein
MNTHERSDLSCTEAGLDKYVPDRRESVKILIQSGLLLSFLWFMNNILGLAVAREELFEAISDAYR